MLEVRNVAKSFGPLRALDRISVQFTPGKIHAVLGENGAGKSTLMNLMAGFMKPDQGTILLDGTELPLGLPFECQRRGIGMVHQHFTLVPNFTVAENLTLASLPSLRGLSNVQDSADKAIQVAESLNWSLQPTELVRNLPVGVQQRIEIIKAMVGNATALIFDEPTAVLTPDEVADLFRVLKTLRDQGKIVILIAHKLSEVLAVADEVTVLRRGKHIASAPIEEVDANQLAQWMVGDLPEQLEKRKCQPEFSKIVANDLMVTGDRGEIAVRKISFEIAKGEIVGFGGMDGNGQVELAEALAGIRKTSGIEFQGIWQDSFAAYIPQDRQDDGLAMGLSVGENLLIGGLNNPTLTQGNFLRPKKIKAWAAELIERFSIKVEKPSDPVSALSGGNQQKVIVSRTLDHKPEFLVVVNPTRGLDIKAADYVQTQILEARNRGAAVALFSTDLDELNLLADRTYFMSRGELVSGIDAVAVVGGK